MNKKHISISKIVHNLFQIRVQLYQDFINSIFLPCGIYSSSHIQLIYFNPYTFTVIHNEIKNIHIGFLIIDTSF